MKKLIIRLFAAASPLIALILFVVFVFDPYNCVHYKTNVAEFTRDTGFTRNERIIKMRHILETDTPYDALLFGSSRATFLYADRYYQNGTIYNMSYAGGLLQEFYENIKVLEKNDRMPKELFIALDSSSLDAKTANSGYVKNYPQSGFLPEIYFSYAKEINLEMLKKCFGYYTGNYEKTSAVEGPTTTAVTTDIAGNYVALYADERIEADPTAHCSKEFFHEIYTNKVPSKDYSAALEQIKEIAQICADSGTKLTLIIIPNYVNTYLADAPASLVEFIGEAVQVCDVYSFAGINELTKDTYNWYELSHFRPQFIGDIICRSVFLGEDHTFYSDGWFGAPITAENIDEYSNYLYSQLQEYGITK